MTINENIKKCKKCGAEYYCIRDEFKCTKCGYVNKEVADSDN